MSCITDIKNELEYIQEENLDEDFIKGNDINKLVMFLENLEKNHPEAVREAELKAEHPLLRNLPVNELNYHLPGLMFQSDRSLQALGKYAESAAHWFFTNQDGKIFESVLDEGGNVIDYKPSHISEIFHMAERGALKAENKAISDGLPYEAEVRKEHRAWYDYFHKMRLSAVFIGNAINLQLEDSSIFQDIAGRKLSRDRYSFEADSRFVFTADFPYWSGSTGNKYSYRFYADYVTISEKWADNGRTCYNFGQAAGDIPLPDYGIIRCELDKEGNVLNQEEKSLSELFSDPTCSIIFPELFNRVVAEKTGNMSAFMQSKKKDNCFTVSDMQLADAKDVEAFLNSSPDPGTHISSSAVRECFDLLKGEDVFLYMTPNGSIAIPPEGGMFDLQNDDSRATGIFKTPLKLEKEFLEHLKACGEYSPAAPVWKELERCIAFYEGRENKNAEKKHRKNSRSVDGFER